MNRDRMIRGITMLCAAVLLCAVIVSAGGLIAKAASGYEHAEKYTAGDAEITGIVKNLEVNWTSGKITVAYHGKETVELRETAKRPIGEDQKMRWWLDGDTLRIQYCKAGLNWSLAADPDKELVLTLPEGIELDSTLFNLTSGDLIIPGMRTGNLQMTATSGNLNAEAEANICMATTTSGDQQLKLQGKTARIQTTATSGNIRIEAEEAGQIQAVCTSGDMDIRAGKNEQANLSGTSTRVRVRLEEMKRLSVNTTSGDVTAELPEAPGFSAQLQTLSGDLETGMALTKRGNQYACGDGSGSVMINTTSGDIRIMPLQDNQII